MLETIKNAPAHVAAIQVSGVMTEQDIEQYQSLMDAKLDSHEHIGMVFDISGLSDFDPAALDEGVRADLDFLRHLNQIERFAVISDKKWPHAIVALYNSLLPGTEAKVFGSAERDGALAWAADSAERAAVRSGPSVRTFATTKDNVIGFEMNSTMTGEDLKPVIDELQSFMDTHEHVGMLNRVKHFGFEPSVFFQSGLMSMKLAALQKVQKYAIVGAPGWMEKAVGVLNPLFPEMDMRTFPSDKEADAWEWLGAQPRDEPTAGPRS
jgi:hypothetical protein